MPDRIFSLVNALLCNDYVIRVQLPNQEGRYDFSDHEDGTEEEVSRCYNRVMSSEYPTLWVFREDDWYDGTDQAEAISMIRLDTAADCVQYHSEYEIDGFITNRVKEAK